MESTAISLSLSNLCYQYWEVVPSVGTIVEKFPTLVYLTGGIEIQLTAPLS